MPIALLLTTTDEMERGVLVQFSQSWLFHCRAAGNFPANALVYWAICYTATKTSE